MVIGWIQIANWKIQKMGINMITEKEFNDLWNSVYYDREAKEFKQTVIKNGD